MCEGTDMEDGLIILLSELSLLVHHPSCSSPSIDQGLGTTFAIYLTLCYTREFNHFRGRLVRDARHNYILDALLL